MNKVALEYRRKRKETPFETFLRYTGEKINSSKVLAKLLNKILKQFSEVDFLDIGSGNGEYLQLTINRIKKLPQINFTLLEPSNDLRSELSKTIKNFPRSSKSSIVDETWENFVSKKRYDIILASHLYHIPREEYPSQFIKMIKYLKPDGYLIFVLRQIDDPYHFKMKFKPRLFDKTFKAKTLNESLETFKDISRSQQQLKISVYKSISNLHFPIGENEEDVVSMIEFYLNKPWNEIPKTIQEEAIRFIKQRNNTFKQTDGIAIIKKLYPL